jgi:hypothetical protein
MNDVDWTAGIPALLTILNLGLVIGMFLATTGYIKVKR